MLFILHIHGKANRSLEVGFIATIFGIALLMTSLFLMNISVPSIYASQVYQRQSVNKTFNSQEFSTKQILNQFEPTRYS